MLNATTAWPVASRLTTPLAIPRVEAPFGPLGLEVGTGGYREGGAAGYVTVVYVRSRGNMGYPFGGYEWSGGVEDAIVGPTVMENISRIRTVLNPTVTDLASLLKVSRQAIYDWQAGKAIAVENAAKLSELARARICLRWRDCEEPHKLCVGQSRMERISSSSSKKGLLQILLRVA
jgi:hypothetical protein